MSEHIYANPFQGHDKPRQQELYSSSLAPFQLAAHKPSRPGPSRGSSGDIPDHFAPHAQQLHFERVNSGNSASTSHRSLAHLAPQPSQHLGLHPGQSSQHLGHYGAHIPSHPQASRAFRASHPEAIVSLIPAGTEILYALGLGSR